MKKYPDHVGVYLMRAVDGTVLYVGKAKNLKSRLNQYFRRQDDRVQVPLLLEQTADIETILTSTEKEALFLEAKLIKRFQPKYNVLLKDDRSGLRIRLSVEHRWPRIELVREHEVTKQKMFGPYSRPYIARELFDLVVRLFKIRQCSDEDFRRRTSPCLLYQLEQCTAPCVRKVSKEDYSKQVSAACVFLDGKIKEVQKNLTSEMRAASQKLAFERAGRIYQSLQLLERLEQEKNCGIGDTDIIGVWEEGSRFALAALHYRESSLVYAETMDFDRVEGVGVEELVEPILAQYYLQRRCADGVPKKIIFSSGVRSDKVFAEFLYDHFGRKVSVKIAKKDEAALAIANARALLSQKACSNNQVLLGLQYHFQLPSFLKVIDCFDASHLSGSYRVAACVSVVDGKKCTQRYRRFTIRSTQVGDDIAMLAEAVSRRYKGGDFPDLLVVDGGELQVQAVKKVLPDVPIIGVVKDRAKHSRGMTEEYVVFNGKKIFLPIHSFELKFLQALRDEAHRFVIEFHKKKRVFSSQLEDIPGIGPKKRKKLLAAFRGIRTLRQASVEEIKQRASLSERDAKQVFESLSEKNLPSNQ